MPRGSGGERASSGPHRGMVISLKSGWRTRQSLKSTAHLGSRRVGKKNRSKLKKKVGGVDPIRELKTSNWNYPTKNSSHRKQRSER